MPLWFWAVLALFLVADAIVFVKLIGKFRERMAQAGIDVKGLVRVARAADARIVEYMRANYSGDPNHLSQAVRGLMPVVRELAAQEGCPLDDRTIKTLVVNALASHRFAPRRRVEIAFDEAIRATGGA